MQNFGVYFYQIIKFFDNFSLLIIILNEIFILISDPRDNDNIANLAAQYFFILVYICIYFKKNILWFCINRKYLFKRLLELSLFFCLFLQDEYHGFQKRAFTILHHLKTLKSVKGFLE